MKNRRWTVLEPDEVTVRELKKLGISTAVAKVLANRGIQTLEDATRFLQPRLKHIHDPMLLKDGKVAATKILSAVKSHKKIIIYGDYDVDGITSTVILYKFIKALGGNVDYYIPSRLEDGYGLNMTALEEIAEKEADLVITVDCGITSIKEVEYAYKLGLEVIVVDHHTVGETVPDAEAVVNPRQENCAYPFEDLAAVGVVFSLLILLKSMAKKDPYFSKDLPDLKTYLDIVALGTVADMVPLLDTNRIFVKYGLKEMTGAPRPGVQALAEVSGIENMEEIDTVAISYKMAPRLNAAGRIGSAKKGVELLLADDLERARKIAEDLNRTNEYRQQVEADIFEEAIAMVEGRFRDRKSLVLFSESWHPGVIGIVASRLVERYYRPTIMIAVEDGIGKGSARSIPSLHIYNVLEELKDLLVQYGGHRLAAGLTIEQKNLEIFRERFEEIVSSSLSDEDFIPNLEIDTVLELKDLTPELVVALSRLEPFGIGNTVPNFLAHNVKIHSQIIRSSYVLWRFEVEGSTMLYDAIGFNLISEDADRIPQKGDLLDIVYYPRINHWQGNVSLQLSIKDFSFVE